MLADRVLARLLGLRPPVPPVDYEARVERTRTLYLVRPVAPAFDWQRDVPELRDAPRRVVERVVVDGHAFYVAHTEDGPR